jgi:hypothetical protein
MRYRRPTVTIAVLLALIFLLSTAANAHNVSKRDAAFVQSNHGSAIPAFMYLGAKHMVTGYDHLAFLIGVIFFLYRLKNIVQTLAMHLHLTSWRPAGLSYSDHYEEKGIFERLICIRYAFRSLRQLPREISRKEGPG